MVYTVNEYVTALHWFGWKLARAEHIVKGKRERGELATLDSLVREYKRNAARG